MDRSHPVYLAITILIAAALQLVLLWKLRRGIKETAVARTDNEPHPEP